MYTGILHIHHWLAVLATLLLVATTLKSFLGWFGDKPFAPIDNNLSIGTLGFIHLQFIFGLILYFISPTIKVAMADMGEAMKDASLRFYAVEHFMMMFLGVVVVTIGRARAKRATTDLLKHKTIAIFFLIGLVLILSRMPWDRLFG